MIKLIDNELERLLAGESFLFQAARYIALAPGKRIRPHLTILTAQMLGCHSPAAVTAGCALEMVHTYSLIHDDLPCMDDDDFRRGKPTLHKVYDEAHAILAGDFLLTYAFEVLADLHLSADQNLRLIKSLSSAAGGEGHGPRSDS